jgi:hypothetical protein
LTAGGGELARTRLLVHISADEHAQAVQPLDVLAIPDGLGPPLRFEIVDGRRLTLPVFRQKGNQGGGTTVMREITEGKGNGNGRLEPGEEATICVQLAQGCDPFDKEHWYRTKVYFNSPWLTEVADLQDSKQLEWTGAKERTSLVRLAHDVPAGLAIPLLLDNESWSFHFTPDVRYGREPLYQAFQLHQHHLHRIELRPLEAQP